MRLVFLSEVKLLEVQDPLSKVAAFFEKIDAFSCDKYLVSGFGGEKAGHLVLYELIGVGPEF
jgi:hypothetical protein